MSHRAPGGNLLCRLIGLGDLDQVERERNMRREILYNRPHQFETPWRMPQGHNNRWNAPFCPHHDRLIQDPRFMPNIDARGRNAEVRGHGQTRTHGGATGRRSRPLDFDDWTPEEIESYWEANSNEIRHFKRFTLIYGLSSGHVRQDPPHNRKWWVRAYRDHIHQLQVGYEDAMKEQVGPQYGYGGRQVRGRGHDHDEGDDSE